jgi:hypothetical protein
MSGLRVRALAAALIFGLGGCGRGGDSTGPPPSPPAEPGWITFNLETPMAEEGGVLVTITPPALDAVEGLNGAEAFSASRGGYWRILVAGDLVSGPLFRIHVPNVATAATYAVQVEQVASRGPAFTARTVGSEYRVVRSSP